MNIPFHIGNPDLCADWPDWVFDNLRAIRRHHATEDQSEESKPSRRHHQRKVRAATLLLDYFLGEGRFASRVPENAFPSELQSDCRHLIAEASNAPGWRFQDD